MAQPGSATGLGLEGRRFESYHFDHYWDSSVVEHPTDNRQVIRSNRIPSTIFQGLSWVVDSHRGCAKPTLISIRFSCYVQVFKRQPLKNGSLAV